MAIKINGVTVIADTQAITTTSTVSATGNISGGNLSIAGTITAAGLDTGSSPISTSGNVTGGNILTGGVISATGNVTGGNVTTGGNVNSNWLLPTTGLSTGGNVMVGGYISCVGNLYVANIVSSQTLTVDDPLVYLTANVTYPYNYDIGFYSAFTGGTGNTYQHTGIVRDYIDNTWKAVSNVPEPAGSAFDFADAIYDGVAMGQLTVNTGLTTATAIVNGGTNGVGNIGASGQTFDTIFAKATTAQYADLAEKYSADAEYAPGTVVSFGGSAEVTLASTDADRKVAGVVSTNPSYIMNSECVGNFVVTVALTGRVPCQVIGLVRKGDLMVSAGYGKARAETDPKVGTVIGKALEDFDGADGIIEVVVGRF